MCQSTQRDGISQHCFHLRVRHRLSPSPSRWEQRHLALQKPAQTSHTIHLSEPQPKEKGFTSSVLWNLSIELVAANKVEFTFNKPRERKPTSISWVLVYILSKQWQNW